MAGALKMVMIMHNEAIEAEVAEALAACGIKNYSKVPGTFGRGDSSGIHLGDDIWPGRNNIMFVACSQKEADALRVEVKRLRGLLGHEGIKSFQWTLDDGDV